MKETTKKLVLAKIEKWNTEGGLRIKRHRYQMTRKRLIDLINYAIITESSSEEEIKK